MITGTTRLIAHLGYPTESFKAPMIYNPYFEREGIDAVVVPMGCRSEDYPAFLKLVFRLSNIQGALVTMPHKVTTTGLVDEVLPTAAIAGACNAVRREADGRLTGEMFDGEGFVRGMLRKGRVIAGARALVLGSGGVGSAIAASLAKAGVSALGLYDLNSAAAEALAARLLRHYPALALSLGSNDPAGFDIVVNATPLGMKPGDPLPLDIARLDAATFVGEVVMAEEITPFLAAAGARGCAVQVGKDMLFEQIPAYLEFFGLPSTTAEDLRNVARLG
ncbi:MAG: shikimate dehydrogenase [Bosea sp.]|uniref:shikimate dehydrogenase family protein n=1 Tax=unclassified Bosea (in: a-proteobacteria) TaxID=2653178 RepID=UPI00095C86F8|nr:MULTISPECIES: shikimate dehydrogenase [unclassified Bosea (in: a-proteobacteria)]MBN9457082.1 shikimate dehydrogenase [Bosea sp. (in: a-proteobacteria)]OJV09891.1 MAG: shikimate dehydrogenase [Bosea sp. 67-29]